MANVDILLDKKALWVYKVKNGYAIPVFENGLIKTFKIFPKMEDLFRYMEASFIVG